MQELQHHWQPECWHRIGTRAWLHTSSLFRLGSCSRWLFCWARIWWRIASLGRWPSGARQGSHRGACKASWSSLQLVRQPLLGQLATFFYYLIIIIIINFANLVKQFHCWTNKNQRQEKECNKNVSHPSYYIAIFNVNLIFLSRTHDWPESRSCKNTHGCKLSYLKANCFVTDFLFLFRLNLISIKSKRTKYSKSCAGRRKH